MLKRKGRFCCCYRSKNGRDIPYIEMEKIRVKGYSRFPCHVIDLTLTLNYVRHRNTLFTVATRTLTVTLFYCLFYKIYVTLP